MSDAQSPQPPDSLQPFSTYKIIYHSHKRERIIRLVTEKDWSVVYDRAVECAREGEVISLYRNDIFVGQTMKWNNG